MKEEEEKALLEKKREEYKSNLATATELLGEEGAGVLQFNNRIVAVLKVIRAIITAVIEFIYKMVSYTMNVTLHYNFGERYLTLRWVLNVFIVQVVYYHLAGLYLATTSDVFGESNWVKFKAIVNVLGIVIIIAVFLFSAVFNYFLQRTEKRKKIQIHTRYIGDSYPLWKYIPQLQKVYEKGYYQTHFEPAVLIVIGCMAFLVLGLPLAFVFIASGVSLFLLHQMQAAKMKEQLLDHLDHKMELEEFNKAVNQWQTGDSIKTQGVVIPAMFNKLPKEKRVGLIGMMGKLDPALQEMYRDSLKADDEEDEQVDLEPENRTDIPTDEPAPKDYEYFDPKIEEEDLEDEPADSRKPEIKVESETVDDEEKKNDSPS